MCVRERVVGLTDGSVNEWVLFARHLLLHSGQLRDKMEEDDETV